MRVLGIDPGLRCTGWGVVYKDGHALKYVAHGVIQSDAQQSLAERLAALHRGLVHILETYTPVAVAVEETFSNQNAVSSLKLGHARGVALAVPALYSVPVFEYSANKVKKSLVGAGHAAKQQVAHMVQYLLPTAGTVTADAADALAVAICHCHHDHVLQKWNVGGSRG